jgi:hypothetical protein
METTLAVLGDDRRYPNEETPSSSVVKNGRANARTAELSLAPCNAGAFAHNATCDFS